MGPLGIVFFSPLIEGVLVAADAARLQFTADIAMHAFVGSVVLGATRATSLKVDAESQPPSGEAAQSMEAVGAGEGRPVVATDRSGQAVVFKEGFKAALHCVGSGVVEGSKFQDHSAVFVAHGEGLDALLVLTSEPPAFEVYGPDVVGSFGFATGCKTTALGCSAAFAGLSQASFFENTFEGALAGRVTGMLATIEFADLAGPPVGMGLFESDDFADCGLGEFVGVAVGAAALLLHTGDAFGYEALPPLVAHSATDAVGFAEFAEVVGGERFHRKFDSLVHFTGLFPRHREASLSLASRARVLPMF